MLRRRRSKQTRVAPGDLDSPLGASFNRGLIFARRPAPCCTLERSWAPALFRVETACGVLLASSRLRRGSWGSLGSWGIAGLFSERARRHEAPQSNLPQPPLIRSKPAPDASRSAVPPPRRRRRRPHRPRPPRSLGVVGTAASNRLARLTDAAPPKICRRAPRGAHARVRRPPHVIAQASVSTAGGRMSHSHFGAPVRSRSVRMSLR